jgi:hypothetical protein
MTDCAFVCARERATLPALSLSLFFFNRTINAYAHKQAHTLVLANTLLLTSDAN